MATAQTELAVNSGITLKARVLSFPEVLAQSVANMAPSAAMALLPLFVFFSAGNALWLSFALGLLDEHLSHCVTEAINTGADASDKVKEASAAIARLVRS